MILIIGKEEKEIVKQKALDLISKCTGFTISKIDYLKSGKPVIEKGYISISDTLNVTIVAYSDKEIGVDIENKDRKIQLKDISIKEWTMLESYYKKLGSGLSLSNVNMNIPLVDITTIEYKNFYISICCEDKDIFINFL